MRALQVADCPCLVPQSVANLPSRGRQLPWASPIDWAVVALAVLAASRELHDAVDAMAGQRIERSLAITYVGLDGEAWWRARLLWPRLVLSKATARRPASGNRPTACKPT